ncbi:CRISPR-associated protein Csn2 [Streptohalobacillus salinus]|uniref:CRISPR-associated protein Csn2 n=1 Tax=Streptohalobacillus salinus TaxID=621096 RepID=A0A2V3WF61_9BACI|nr:type II-A CRISPR-associated protein Csn2 [Streptohalobacillus salinus]PXW91791.1 CRISPR-associated protein Csn2 [Streptohalobacillus salinus]
MMKLNYPVFDESITLEKSPILVLDNATLFSDFVQAIFNYEDSPLKLYDQSYQSLKASELLVITDILGFELNSATILKHIYTDLESQLNDEPMVKTELEKLMMSINDIISDQLLEHDLDIQTTEITFPALFKALNIKINNQAVSVNDKIADIIQLFKYQSRKKLLIFVNVCSYLTKVQIEETRSYLSLNSVTALFIEPRTIQELYQYILDEDYYLSYEKVL